MIIILCPVIMRTPDTFKTLKRKDKTIALSRFARQSVMASAQKSNLPVTSLKKNDQGVPMPSNNVFWSVTHKDDMVAGVVSPEAVGIDIEKIKPVSDSLFYRVVDSHETELFKNQDHETVFFRVFTAKEAVLKKTGIGIKGLSQIKIKAVLDKENLVAEYLNEQYLVENYYLEGYLAAITKDEFDIKWTIE